MSAALQGTSGVTTLHADELQPGDVVWYGGRTRRITHVERRDGWAWPVAGDSTGWAIALDHSLIGVNCVAAQRSPWINDNKRQRR
jgi:hypothetical protein